jgi:hypothetical protein
VKRRRRFPVVVKKNHERAPFMASSMVARSLSANASRSAGVDRVGIECHDASRLQLRGWLKSQGHDVIGT